MNTAEDHPTAALTDSTAKRVTSQGVAGVYSDSYDVAGLNARRVELRQCFVAYDGIAERSRRGRCQDE
jgi:hypothetical protein